MSFTDAPRNTTSTRCLQATSETGTRPHEVCVRPTDSTHTHWTMEWPRVTVWRRCEWDIPFRRMSSGPTSGIGTCFTSNCLGCRTHLSGKSILHRCRAQCTVAQRLHHSGRHCVRQWDNEGVDASSGRRSWLPCRGSSGHLSVTSHSEEAGQRPGSGSGE